MRTDKNEYVLYGIKNREQVIEKIVDDLGTLADSFSIRLMLTEALTNAHNHGNMGSDDKPIFLRYLYDEAHVRFEIQDSGSGMDGLLIPDAVSDDDILNEHGRGLFLISCMADKVFTENNTLVIQKDLTTFQKRESLLL